MICKGEFRICNGIWYTRAMNQRERKRNCEALRLAMLKSINEADDWSLRASEARSPIFKKICYGMEDLLIWQS